MATKLNTLLLLIRRRTLILGALIPISLLSFYYVSYTDPLHEEYQWKSPERLKPTICTPEQYTDGSWSYRPKSNATTMTFPEDALQFSGLQGCASHREYFLQLGADHKEQYDRFPLAQSWEWIPGAGCEGLGRLNSEALVKQLVEEGGWYLIGGMSTEQYSSRLILILHIDSITENHFFSLSCILFPHVYSSPDYRGGFDRSWPQNLYLSPSSPLLESLTFPDGFNITSMPLVIFRRNDLLLGAEHLERIHAALQPGRLEDQKLFSDEAAWTIPVEEYLSEFITPLPTLNYGTLIVSTGGHWNPSLFSHVAPKGMLGVLDLFDVAMGFWARDVQDMLRKYNAVPTHTRKKKAIVRAYLPGHDDCHTFRKPWMEIEPFKHAWYNWAEIWKFNAMFEVSHYVYITCRQS